AKRNEDRLFAKAGQALGGAQGDVHRMSLVVHGARAMSDVAANLLRTLVRMAGATPRSKRELELTFRCARTGWDCGVTHGNLTGLIIHNYWIICKHLMRLGRTTLAPVTPAG